MLNEEVRKIMTTEPKVVNPNQSLQEVTELMLSNKMTQLPVVSDGKLVGMVTTYDLWKQNVDISDNAQKTVNDVMTTKVIKLEPKDKVGTAAELFMDKRFKTLPVVNLEGKLKGVVTAFDVMRYTLKKEYPTAILYSDVIEQ